MKQKIALCILLVLAALWVLSPLIAFKAATIGLPVETAKPVINRGGQ